MLAERRAAHEAALGPLWRAEKGCCGLDGPLGSGGVGFSVFRRAVEGEAFGAVS